MLDPAQSHYEYFAYIQLNIVHNPLHRNNELLMLMEQNMQARWRWCCIDRARVREALTHVQAEVSSLKAQVRGVVVQSCSEQMRYE